MAVVDNRSGYDTGDLTAYLERAFRALGVRRPIHVVIVASPIRSRGCALVGQRTCKGRVCTVAGEREMVLALASPHQASRAEFYRRLACLVRHEALHVEGFEHGAMSERDLYSLGPMPAWARGLRLRYRGRAPDQLAVLRNF